jgi:hypothetical protein
MRFYAFGNYYLSSLQQALQANHVCVEMYNMYNYQFLENREQEVGLTKTGAKNLKTWGYLKSWARSHKTIVLLNGGNSKDLSDIYSLMNCEQYEEFQHDYPYAKFCEDQDSLCGALTSVGIVLPPLVYETAAND